MKQEEITKLQNVQLELLEEVHRICEKYNIKYYMIAGTLLGAVRHKGFIPWDIDIDIAMYREDYLKFKSVCGKEKSNVFDYFDYTVIKKYNHPHAMVCKKNTEIVFKYDRFNTRHKCHGIHLDIFPLDNAPEKELLKEKQRNKLYRIRRLKQFRVPYTYSKNKWKRRIHYLISDLLIWIPIDKINHYEQKIMQTYNNEEAEYTCSMASKYEYKKECLLKEIYGEPVLLEFCGKEYYAPQKYKEYLRLIYGEYMKLPPIEEQKAILDVVVDYKLG